MSTGRRKTYEIHVRYCNHHLQCFDDHPGCRNHRASASQDSPPQQRQESRSWFIAGYNDTCVKYHFVVTVGYHKAFPSYPPSLNSAGRRIVVCSRSILSLTFLPRLSPGFRGMGLCSEKIIYCTIQYFCE